MSEILDSRFEDQWQDALSRGELQVQICGACDRVIMYPKYRCPTCASSSLSMVSVSGEGTLTSHAVIRVGSPREFTRELPYAVGVIRLIEGVQVLARLKPDDDGEWTSYDCDVPVHFVGTMRGPSGWAPWFAVDSRRMGTSE